jgi:predicted metal-binding membrane protein
MNADAVYRRDRAIVLAAIVGVTALAWLYMYDMATHSPLHGGHPGILGAVAWCVAQAHQALPDSGGWSAEQLLLAFLMWNVMMVGMMIPTASPMILTFAATHRRQRQRPFVPTAFFVSGYVLVWAAYSVAATLGQWGLHSASLLTSVDTVRATPAIGGLLLLVAGAFQWSSLKYNCLTHCRSPLSFLLTEWREGRRGALAMGLKHGAYCVGCCWAIMALMVVAGAMNLLWTAVLAGYMLLEKVIPRGQEVGRVVGVAFLVAGAWMLWGSFV